MTLKELVSPFSDAELKGNANVEVKGLALDSRKVRPGDVFVALRGGKEDGARFIPAAEKSGAVAVISEAEVETGTMPSVKLGQLRDRLGKISSALYGHPSWKLVVVGVTGTNGKTTTALLLEALFQKLGKRSGYIGTLAYRWNGFETDAERTTPEANDLQSMMRTMVDSDVTHLVLECSSHAVEMGRLNGLELDAAVFTNLTQDHLDFHGTMENYKAAKEKLFTDILGASGKPKKIAVLNIDDSVGAEWSERLSMSKMTYSVRSSSADVSAKNVHASASGIKAEICVGMKVIPISSPLVGEHNLYNLLAAIASAVAIGIPAEKAAELLASISSVPGRLERVPSRNGVHVFVDYAHTDDALKNVLNALKPLRQKRMIVVFGCGGDRDRTKRPKMAKVVSEMADVTLITSDNPRTEAPEEIVREIEKGIVPSIRSVRSEELNAQSKGVVCTIVDRKVAIERGLEISTSGDIVLIAGKGHETYQEVNGVKNAFDDRIVAREWLERRAA
jgi:UDP-N-acetylmuramoyl-L-alanyl-D-glutamate--2,6-diaminopimelate ligase